MRSTPTLAALVVSAAALAGCAGSGSGSASHRAAIPASGSRPTKIYRVHLSGANEVPHGPTAAVGAAIIAFHGAPLVCWRFAHLHGFTHATGAQIDAGATGRTGHVVISLSPGPLLHHQGCVSVTPALSRSIWADPSGYYVNVNSRRHPSGAIRAQL